MESSGSSSALVCLDPGPAMAGIPILPFLGLVDQ